MAFLDRIFFFIIVNVIGITVVAAADVAAQSADSRPTFEYQLKASLIFNFLQFIEWPPGTMEQSESTLRICVVGPDHFGIALNSLEQEIIKGNHIKVARLSSSTSDKLKSCQVVFVSQDSPNNETDQIFQTLRNSSALTIGETSDFMSRGGIINVQIDKEKIVFDINRPAALAARLNVSAKLLRIARNVIE